MKLTTTLLIFLIIITLSSAIVLAEDKQNFGSQEETTSGCENRLACNSTLSSAAGFGAVELCGECKVCGEPDGVCPEDFYSGGLQGSCSQCPDPDCTATLRGRVIEGIEEQPLRNAKIMAKYPGDELFSVIAQTTTDGRYLEYPMAANPIEMFATYTDNNALYNNVYISSPTINVSLSRGETKEINFTVFSAPCEADCTRVGNDICDATCQGENDCDFAHNNKYLANTTKEILDGSTIGTNVTLYSVDDCEVSYTITEDIATSCTGPITEKVSYYLDGACGNSTQFQITQSDNDKSNLITKTVRVYTGGRVAILTIVYWEGEEGK